jgi:hypothetical protein
MSAIRSLFESQNTVTVTISKLVKTQNSEGQMSDPTFTPILSNLTALFWRGSMSQQVISEQLKPEVEAVFALDPNDITVAIPDGSKATANGIDYSIIYSDDIAGQNEVFILPVKKYKS